VTWTRITDPETVAGLLPAWFGRRMVGLRGTFGLLLTTGDVLRLTSIAAAHQSSQGASVATVNLAHVVAAVEFTVAEMALNPGDTTMIFRNEIEEPNLGSPTEAVGQAVE
jgi:hypothetical protein